MDKTITERAREAGLPEATARKYANLIGVKPKSRRKPISDAEWQKIRDAIAEVSKR